MVLDMDEITPGTLLKLITDSDLDTLIRRSGVIRSDGVRAAVNIQLDNGQTFRLQVEELDS